MNVMQNVLIFGASGHIGRNLIRKLTKNNYKITVLTRSIHQKAYLLKTQGNAGYIDIVEGSIFDENNLVKLVKNADICINLIGILFEKGKINNFKNIHISFPETLSKLCNQYGVKKLIHLSALGIDEAKDSKYAQSKLSGENLIQKNFDHTVILRPSVVYSVNDNFTTNFMTLLSILPIFPLYYNGRTKFMPIHCSDLTDIILAVIEKNINDKIIECIGPEQITLKEIIQKLLILIKKKRLLLPMPLFIAKFTSLVFGLFPKPLITIDQLKLLKYDNIKSGKNKTNIDLGLNHLNNFDTEVEKYCYMWRKRGQFSKKNIN
jgi:NADH dehydrogenase